MRREQNGSYPRNRPGSGHAALGSKVPPDIISDISDEAPVCLQSDIIEAGIGAPSALPVRTLRSSDGSRGSAI